MAGAVRFVDDSRGWIAGGPAGDKLYSTQDGGASWQALRLDLGQGIASQSYVALPHFTSARDGWLAVTVADPLNPHVDLFTTVDAGKTWDKRGAVSIDPALNPASTVASVLLEGDRWLLAKPGKPAMYTLRPGALPDQTLTPALPVSALPEGVVQIINSSSTVSWALVQEGNCSGYKAQTG